MTRDSSSRTGGLRRIVLPSARAKPGPAAGPDRERLERVLQDLVACRQLLDSALKEG